MQTIYFFAYDLQDENFFKQDYILILSAAIKKAALLFMSFLVLQLCVDISIQLCY